MALIQIFAKGIELDYINDTLSIKEDFNVFTNDFKVSASAYPFLIIENAATKTAMGPREIASVNKKIVIDVVVLQGGKTYSGRLQVLNYMGGYRKCNLMYGSAALQVLDKKLGDVLPVLSIIPGETTPKPFTEEGTELVPGHERWATYPLPFNGKIYPEVKFGFPQMYFPTRYFDTPPEDETDDLYYMGRFTNAYYPPTPALKTNNYVISGNTVDVVNQNVVAPQLFLLGMLDYAFASIGWKIAGDFVTSDFARRLMVTSLKDNMCKVPIGPNPIVLNYPDFPNIGAVNSLYSAFSYKFTPTDIGTYTFIYYIHEILHGGGLTTVNNWTGLRYTQDGQSTAIYVNHNDPDNLIFQGSFDITVDESQIGKEIRIQHLRRDTTVATNPIQFGVTQTRNTRDFYMMHPTIQLGRYAPEWVVADAINEIGKLFCLKVTFDDISQTVYLNFATNLLLSPDKFVSKKSLAITNNAPAEFEAYVFKYANTEDTYLYVDKKGITLNKTIESDLVEIMESKFKLLPVNNVTADLSGADDKAGVGLMIYDPAEPSASFTYPNISTTYNGYTLRLNGTLGIYNQYWKTALSFLLNASVIEVEGPYTRQEVKQMAERQKMHIDNQEYLITAMEYSPMGQDNYNVKFTLKSITL